MYPEIKKKTIDTKEEGRVIWITGLSASGKTTLAKKLMPFLSEKSILLDGDELRAALGMTQKAFDSTSRKELAFTYARLCNLLAKQGATVVCATISMFHELHDWNRKNLQGYFEIFINISEETRKKRDPKGLYAQDSNKCGPMVDCNAELPQKPDLRIEEYEQENDKDLEKILSALLSGKEK